jgi:hypothetical protein
VVKTGLIYKGILMEESGENTHVPYMMSRERKGKNAEETFVFNPEDFPDMEYDDIADQIMLEELLQSHRAFWGIKPKSLIKPK